MSKLGGVGIVNLLIIWLFIVIMTVGMKAILTNLAPESGVTKIIQAV